MTCADVTSILQTYLDGETDMVTASRVAVHLRTCGACRAEADAFARQDALLKTALAGDARDTDALRARILAGLPSGPRRRAPLWAAAAAAAVLLASGALALVNLAAPGDEPVADDHVAETAPETPPAPPTAPAGPVDGAYAAAAAEHERMVRTGGPATRDLPALSRMVLGFTGDRPVDLELAGLRLVAGHPCHIGEVPYAHLVYALPDGRKVSVYLCKEGGTLPKGRETVASAEGGVEIARLDGRTAAFSDARGVRRAVVVDGGGEGEVLAILGKIR
jgi:anti-sigma factor RsiW